LTTFERADVPHLSKYANEVTLTSHMHVAPKIHLQQTQETNYVNLAGFKPAIPAIRLLQTNALYRTATGTGFC